MKNILSYQAFLESHKNTVADKLPQLRKKRKYGLENDELDEFDGEDQLAFEDIDTATPTPDQAKNNEKAARKD